MATIIAIPHIFSREKYWKIIVWWAFCHLQRRPADWSCKQAKRSSSPHLLRHYQLKRSSGGNNFFFFKVTFVDAAVVYNMSTSQLFYWSLTLQKWKYNDLITEHYFDSRWWISLKFLSKYGVNKYLMNTFEIIFFILNIIHDFKWGYSHQKIL